jgi:type II secretory pathway component GspD/PulD (secretin)
MRFKTIVWVCVTFIFAAGGVHAQAPQPMEQASELLNGIKDPKAQQIIRLALQGITKEQIASQLNMTVKDVERIIIDNLNNANLDQGQIFPQDQTVQAQPQEEIPGPSSAKITSTTEGKLDVLDLRKMEVSDVLKLISQKSGINIVGTQNVKGQVTVYLKNVTVEEALKIIAEANDWAYIKDKDIIKVMTNQEYEAQFGYRFGKEVQTKIVKLTYASATDVLATLSQIKNAFGKVISDEKSNTLILVDTNEKLAEMDMIIKQLDVPTETKVFDLSYAKAEEVAGKITETLTPVIGRSRFDARSNRIVITDTPRKLAEISKIVDAFDQKHKEVFIEAKIVQVVLTDAFKKGINWEAIVQDYHRLDFKSTFDVLSTTEKGGRLGIGTLDRDNYTAVIDALKSVGATNILSSPRIAAINNQEAKILVGSTEPYVTTTTTTPASGPTTTAEAVNFIEVGVKLYVTPTIHNDGFVTMKIKPEVSSVVDNLVTSNNNRIPIVETSQAETTVMVKDNVTIVIGGLIKEQKVKTTDEIPFLGSIPILGEAFKRHNDTTDKTEIVIFLTPKIVTGDVTSSQLSLRP